MHFLPSLLYTSIMGFYFSFFVVVVEVMNKKQQQQNSNNRLQKKPINPERALAYLDFSFCVVRMP